MNAIELLKKDHREALELIGNLETADDEPGTDPTDTEKFNELKESLELHTQIEEELLYPLMRQVEETRDLIDGAYGEHEEVNELLTRLSVKAPNQKEFQEHLKEIKAALERHIEKEEVELFPKVEEAVGPDELTEMGNEIQQRKLTGLARPAAMKGR